MTWAQQENVTLVAYSKKNCFPHISICSIVIFFYQHYYTLDVN